MLLINGTEKTQKVTHLISLRVLVSKTVSIDTSGHKYNRTALAKNETKKTKTIITAKKAPTTSKLTVGDL